MTAPRTLRGDRSKRREVAYEKLRVRPPSGGFAASRDTPRRGWADSSYPTQAPFERIRREAYEMAAAPAFGQAIGQCSTSARRSLHVLGLDPVKSDVGPVAGGEGAA